MAYAYYFPILNTCFFYAIKKNIFLICMLITRLEFADHSTAVDHHMNAQKSVIQKKCSILIYKQLLLPIITIYLCMSNLGKLFSYTLKKNPNFSK